MASAAQSEFKLPPSYDLAGTLWQAGMGNRDPSLSTSARSAAFCFVTPDGPVTVQAQHHERRLQVACIGEGSAWAEGRLEALFGLKDDPSEFCPGGKLGDLVRQRSGIHLPTLPVLFPRLVQIVLQQLVQWGTALKAWIEIVRRYGVDAPCGELRLPPSAELIRDLGDYDLIDCGILPKQARIVLLVAQHADRIERLAVTDREALERFLLAIPGIGPWTVQYLLGSSCGYADAMMLGDYGLPHTVAWFFLGQERSNDEEMVHILEPYRGHRFRVINHLMQANISAPRRGPRRESHIRRLGRTVTSASTNPSRNRRRV